jgi:general secretion pathway protein D
MKGTKHFRGVLAVLLVVTLAGCASYRQESRAIRLIAGGETGEGVQLLQQLAQRDPDRYRLKYVKARDRATHELMQKAQLARLQGRSDEALAAYNAILQFDPQHADARQGLELIARDQRAAEQLGKAKAALDKGDRNTALQILNEILVANPQHGEARGLRQGIDLERNREMLAEPTLKASLTKPVSLEFRNASVQAIFEVLSQSSGISFIFDKDVKSDLKTTLFARDTTVGDALNLILRTNQLSQKVLNDSTLLIYPATPEKEKQYEDLVMRTFYLGSADPKKVQEMIRALVAPKSMYVDDSLKMLVVRDNLSVIETVERLIAAYDLAKPEVTLDVEILEIGSDALLNLGIQYPDQVRASVFGAAGKAGQLTVREAENLERDNFQLFLPDPLAVLNLKQTSGRAKTLANPKIRVSNREKAKVLVGDKVPVITTTTNQTSSASTESVSYLDVGLKLEVEPEIHVNNDVSINVGLEVSNIVKEIKSTTGLLTYQIGTRNATTTLRLRDGETQVLAGLIKNEERDSASHLPGLGKIPVLGKLFSNETNTSSRSEIVLLITPHVVRSLATPAAHVLEFSSGTGTRASIQPMRLTPAARYSNTDKKLLNTEATGVTKTAAAIIPASSVPAPATTPADVAAAPVAVVSMGEAASANIRLDIVTPAQIPQNREFTVALMISAQAFEELEFDLVFDQPGFEMVRITPVVNASVFDAQLNDDRIHVKVGQAAASSGPLAMLTLRTNQVSGVPVMLSLQNPQGRKAGDIPAQVALPAPRQVLVTP